MKHTLIAIFLILLSARSPLACANTEDPSPYDILAKARSVWRAQQYPPQVTYTVHVQTLEGVDREDRHYRSRWFAHSNLIFVDPVSAEQLADPYAPPPGVDLDVFGLKGHVGGPSKGTGTDGDLIGIPYLSPNYSFGISPNVPPRMMTSADIVAQVRSQYDDPAPNKIDQPQQADGMKTIASVYTPSGAYDVALDGTVNCKGHTDYHLSLVPRREPHRYRLRDIWINTATYQIDQIRSAGNFVDGGTSSVPWLIAFQAINGVEYIETERTERPISHWYDAICISFEQISASKEPINGQVEAFSPTREP